MRERERERECVCVCVLPMNMMTMIKNLNCVASVREATLLMLF